MLSECEPYSREVFYYETDRMGVVHHSNYVRWLEEARSHFLKQANIPYEEMEKEGIIVPVLSVSVKYRKHMTYGDVMQVYIRLVRLSYLKFDFEYKIINAKSGELCATAESSHCFLNSSFKPFRFHKEFPEYYRILTQCLERDSGAAANTDSAHASDARADKLHAPVSHADSAAGAGR